MLQLHENALLRQIFKDSKKDFNKGSIVKFTEHVDTSCLHQTCACYIQVEGTCQALLGYSDRINWSNLEESVKLWVGRFTSVYDWDGGAITEQKHQSAAELIARISGTNLRVLDPPINWTNYPKSGAAVYSNPEVMELTKVADRIYQRKRYLHSCPSTALQRIYEQPPLPDSHPLSIKWQKSLTVQEKLVLARNESLYHIAFGTTDGYPHYTQRSVGIFPQKGPNALLKNCKGTDKAQLPFKEVEPYFRDALDYFYMSLGTRPKWGTLRLGFDMDSVMSRQLHASSGRNAGEESVTQVDDNTTLRKTPNGLKYECNTADMRHLLEFISDPTADPVVYWENYFKNENGTHPGKRWTPEQWAENELKIRTFVCPSSLFGLIELLIGQRMGMERGSVIRVGMPWKKGGMDWLARCLGLKSITQMTKKILVEGDATNFDQSVWARLVDMYMSFGLIYDDESHPDSESPVRKRLTQWLVKNLLVRVMHAFGPVWVEQKGGVPSGCQNTSHMDSWIMALWLFLFAVTQASKASPEIQKKIFDKLISGEIAFIVYGDDHVYSMSEDESLHPYLDGVNFRFFMQKYFNVEIRDLKTSTTFLSFAEGGRLVHVGMCFLKHYAVLNPYKDSHPNQPLTLPYRETKEYIAKAIIGRETVRTRTPFDVLLSSIGHAYNTYASNRDAYDKLLCLYQACKLSLDFKSDDDITNYFLQNYPLEIETYNKIGLTLQEIQAGFPSWETLIEQNRVDAEYHLTTFVNSRWSDRFSD